MEIKETVFIFSGYSKEMDKFMDLNPGIKSRIGYHIDFNDYDIEELLLIFKSKLVQSNFKITEEAYENIKSIVEVKKNEKNFGNGRMIDNLYNEILLEHASLNYDNKNEDELLIITNDAVNNVMSKTLKRKRGGYFE